MVHKLLICIFSLCATSSFCLADDELSFQPSLYGQCTDSMGKPVVDATVRVAFCQQPSRFLAPPISNGTFVATTNSNGEFRLTLNYDDPRLHLQRGFPCQMQLFVEAEGRQLHAIQLPPQRCLIDLPLIIQLQPADAFAIQIVAADGRPAPNTRVLPAQIGSLVLPLDHSALELKSDSAGYIAVTYANRQQLKRIYVIGPDGQGQCLPVKVVNGTLTARMLATHAIMGKVNVKQDPALDTPSLSAIVLHFVATQDNYEPATVQDELAFGWCSVEVADDGRFTIDQLPIGKTTFTSTLPYDFPYSFDVARAFEALSMVEKQIALELHPRRSVQGRVIRSDTGEGIPYITFDHINHEGRPTTTADDGSFSYWSSSERPNLRLRPRCDFGRFVFTGRLVNALVGGDGGGQLAPILMTPMASSVGTVVDQNNQPVPNATVDIRVGGRTVQQCLSDRAGKFRFFGLPPSASIELSAHRVDLGGARSIKLLLEDGAQPVIKLEAIETGSFVGKVVDQSGKAIKDATIVVQRGDVLEDFRGVSRRAVTLFSEQAITTDALGRFQSPATAKLELSTSFVISAPGYRTLRSGWARRLPQPGTGEVDCGTFALLPAIVDVDLKIAIVDGDSGAPIKQARIVSLGSLSGIVKRELQDSSTLDLRVKNSPQVLAVFATGYVPSFISILPTQDPVEVRLYRNHQRALQPVVTPMEELPQLAGQLLELTHEKQFVDDLYRRNLYLACLSFAAPLKALDRYLELEPGPELADMIEFGVRPQLARLPDDRAEQFIALMSDQAQSLLYPELAKRHGSQEQQKQLFNKALERVRKLAEFEQIEGYTRIACAMLKVRLDEDAHAVIREAWGTTPELAENVRRGTRIEVPRAMLQNIRSIAPLLALVDRRTAMKLVDLTADDDNRDQLRFQVIACLAAVNAPGWESVLEAFVPTGTESHSTRLVRWQNDVGFRDVDSGLKLADTIPASIEKSSLLLHLADHATEDVDERVQLAQRSLAILRELPNSRSSLVTSQIAAAACESVRGWSEPLAAEFAFESLWNCENVLDIRPHALISEVAIYLASYDRAIARTLIEPCLEDWSWLFGEQDLVILFESNQPLRAAATIDPAWAANKVEELLSGPLQNDPSRQLATLFCVISRWSEMFAQQAELTVQRIEGDHE